MDNKEEYSDAQLIRLLQDDPEYFGILMNKYQRQLFHYVRRLTQLPQDDVEDLLQEIFIKIYTKINAYNDTLHFSSWAYRVAHNHVVDYFRRANARPQTNVLEEEEWEKLISGSIQVEKDFWHKDCVEHIKKYIDALPMQYREVLILRFVEEKTYEEIMDILEKPKGTVATLIARGKKMLITQLRRDNINCYTV